MLTVAPDWTYTLQLPHDPRAPGIARTTLRAVLKGHAMTELVETAELLAGEMVTNAYRHTDGPSSMRLRGLPAGRLRVTVWDTEPTIPPPFDKPPCAIGSADMAEVCGDAEAEDGRGLHIVRLCADNWGSCLLGDGGLLGPRGKLLWIELAPRNGFAMAA